MTASAQRQVIVCGAFDDIRSPQIRFLEEASALGEVHVFLWSDDVVGKFQAHRPKFPVAERQYFLQSLRFVHRVTVLKSPPPENGWPSFVGERRDRLWVVAEPEDGPGQRAWARAADAEYRVLPSARLNLFPPASQDIEATSPGRKKVIVTGSYDWLHSGHIRFFEEVSSYGDLYVVVGHDANIRLLKGEGHPLLPQDERRYVVSAVRFVKQALITSGHGWLDADPEIQRLQPDIYAVNEDGDKGGKREYCAARNIEYLVLRRSPAPGLPRRSSTDLRGF